MAEHEGEALPPTGGRMPPITWRRLSNRDDLRREAQGHHHTPRPAGGQPACQSRERPSGPTYPCSSATRGDEHSLP